MNVSKFKALLTAVDLGSFSAAAQKLVNILLNNAAYLRSGGGESNQSLLIQLESGLVLQMAVNGE